MTYIKDILYNLLFALVLTLYSVQVCPHVSGLGILITGVSFTLVVSPLFLIRRFIVKKTRQKSTNFWINLSYFTLIGLFVGLYNYLFRQFPIESAMKIVSGALVLGALNAAIFQLEEPFHRSKSRVSFLNLIALFAISLLGLISVVWTLLIVEDINIFQSVQNGSMIDLRKSIIYESVFVWLVIVLYALRVIYLYKQRIGSGIQGHLNTLKQVNEDNLDVALTRFSNDEFSVIGDEVNNMIKRLRKGREVKQGLDRIAGEQVSDEIVERISRKDFSSEKKNVAILFTDIVGFTSLCEQSDPKEFINSLNDHFEKIVAEVKKYDGIVNKFIGDAVLVYFEGDQACDRAYNAAAGMLNKSHFKIGVGIHYGEVLAGLIGASKRLEYTIIGSSVNLTARLESESRKLETELVLSQELVNELNAKNKEGLKNQVVNLKGFEREVLVFYK
ncbi:MAG: adenylate/guanylate cyclase domain-containing protein [Crocinitomicaceae bacterium]|nr:adenylate/guanylate cyclase domain-containing protein [Crocinitomicaceae bacterium]